MNTRRLETLAMLLILMGTACTVLPTAHTPPRAETRRVAIPGEEADALAETSGGAETSLDDEVLVPVHTHDGRDLWVREASLGGATLVPGTWVLMRRGDALVSAAVTRSLDDYVEVDVAGTPTLVPVSDVLARLHRSPIAPPIVPPTAVVTEPPPLTPLAEMVALDVSHTMRAAIVMSCTGGNAHVVFPDESETDVAMSDLHPMRVRAGDRVTALWSGSPYPGLITDTRDSLVHVRWEDATEQWIDRTDVRSVDGTSALAIQGCPRRTVLVDEGARTSIGRLLACDGSSATVLGADGTPRGLARDSLARVPLHVGDAIEARWNGSPYDATVLSLGARIHIRWYDGSEADVDPADLVTMRTREVRAPEAPACPAA